MAECRGSGLGVRHFADSLETCSTGKVFYLERNSSRTRTHPSRPVFILSLLPTEEEQRSPARQVPTKPGSYSPVEEEDSCALEGPLAGLSQTDLRQINRRKRNSIVCNGLPHRHSNSNDNEATWSFCELSWGSGSEDTRRGRTSQEGGRYLENQSLPSQADKFLR